eukprot:Amastigsp_a52_319.p2 type:complete len:119 gc:universal Amastigsp_a52_319:346-702(+)
MGCSGRDRAVKGPGRQDEWPLPVGLGHRRVRARYLHQRDFVLRRRCVWNLPLLTANETHKRRERQRNHTRLAARRGSIVRGVAPISQQKTTTGLQHWVGSVASMHRVLMWHSGAGTAF